MRGENKGVKNGYYNFLPMQEKFCFKVSLFNKVAPPYAKARQVLSARRNNLSPLSFTKNPADVSPKYISISRYLAQELLLFQMAIQ